MKKSSVVVILALMFIYIFLDITSSEFTLGSNNLTNIYSRSENIKGWINISFDNQPSNSSLSAFESNISLINFLNNNSAVYSCSPVDCQKKYVSSEGEDGKNTFLDYNKEKIYSFKIQGTIESISDIEFRVSAVNPATCISPLSIDILDDGQVEWKSKKHNSDYSCIYESGYGCFDLSEESQDTLIDNVYPYCEKILLPESGSYFLGSWVKKGVTPWQEGLLEMSLYDLSGNLLDSCDLPEPNESEIGCVIDYYNSQYLEHYVCLKATDEIEGYTTKKENVDSCGFYSFPGDETEYHDYHIFARASKFDSIGEAYINQEEYESYGNAGHLKDYIMDYITERYEGDCAEGCSIPIKFKSFSPTGLNLFVYGAKIRYSSGSGPEISSLIYDTKIESALIDSPMQKLNLEKASLKVPDSFGEKNLLLKIDGQTILDEEIFIADEPKIIDINPKQAGSLVPTTFFIILDNEKINKTFVWDFGDGTKEKTSSKSISHIYSTIGKYNLTVSIDSGDTSKTIQVNVGSPKEFILPSINEKLSGLSTIEKQLDVIPDWINQEIKKILNVGDLRQDLESLKKEYESGFSEQDYVRIMSSLNEIEIPLSFNISQNIEGQSVLYPDKINFEVLETLGADFEQDKDYEELILNWMSNNLDINIESNTYSLYYQDRTEDLFSYLTIDLKSKKDKLEKIYFLINGNSDKIKIKDDIGFKNFKDSFGGVLTEFDSKTIEFLYPGKIEIEKMPIFISPEFSELEQTPVTDICNFNGVCDKNNRENYKNCRSDCTPYFYVALFLGILIFVFLVVYVILQEWYKKHYQSKLFSDKNQLFNIINFMNNLSNQGVDKSIIFSKLKELDWNGEQLEFAWRKLNGKRTGMWEIPIFKWFEKKEVRKELEKRQDITQPGLKEVKRSDIKRIR